MMKSIKLFLILFSIISTHSQESKASPFSSEELYIEMQKVIEQTRNYSLSEDSVRLLNLSEGNAANLHSLLTLENPEIQKEGKVLVDIIESISRVARKERSNVHILISLIPELQKSFQLNPGKETFAALLKEINFLSKYLKLQTDSNRLAIALQRDSIQQILQSYRLLMRSMTKSSLQKTGRLLRSSMGGPEISPFNPYLLDHIFQTIPRLMGQMNAQDIDAQQLQALLLFSKNIHGAINTSPSTAQGLFPLILHLEQRVMDLLNGNTVLPPGYIQRIGSNETVLHRSPSNPPNPLNPPVPGFGLYFEFTFKAELLYVEILTLNETKKQAFDSFNSHFDELIQQKITDLQKLMAQYQGMPYFSHIPFLSAPVIAQSALNKSSLQTLLNENRQIRRLLLEAAVPLAENDFFMRETSALNSIYGVTPQPATIVLSDDELQRLTEIIDDSQSLEYMVRNNSIYEMAKTSLYEGVLKVQVLPLLQPTTSPKITYYQKLLSIELIRALNTASSNVRQYRLRYLNNNLNFLNRLRGGKTL